jgi:hypothetical protein
MCLDIEESQREQEIKSQREQADLEFANIISEISEVKESMAHDQISQKTFDSLAKTLDHLIVQHNAILGQIEALRF